MAKVTLTPQDAERIAEAVAAAERGASAEIRCVIADGRDPLQAALAAGCVALVLPALALLVGLDPQALLVVATRGWTAAHGGADPQGALHGYLAVQAVVLVVALAVALSPIPRWLTPVAWRKAAVDREALAQFEALGLTNTADRTGVLLYVSLAHHRAEVLADEGIYARAPHQAWDEVIALLTEPLSKGRAADGFVAAVGRVGELLAAHLPPGEDNINELPNAPVTLR